MVIDISSEIAHLQALLQRLVISVDAITKNTISHLYLTINKYGADSKRLARQRDATSHVVHLRRKDMVRRIKKILHRAVSEIKRIIRCNALSLQSIFTAP